MKDFQTIIGVIELKSQGESLGTIQRRYGIGHSTVERILDRRFELGLTLEELKAKQPKKVEELFYPSDKIRRKNVPMPDFDPAITEFMLQRAESI